MRRLRPPLAALHHQSGVEYRPARCRVSTHWRLRAMWANPVKVGAGSRVNFARSPVGAAWIARAGEQSGATGAPISLSACMPCQVPRLADGPGFRSTDPPCCCWSSGADQQGCRAWKSAIRSTRKPIAKVPTTPTVSTSRRAFSDCVQRPFNAGAASSIVGASAMPSSVRIRPRWCGGTGQRRDDLPAPSLDDSQRPG